MAPYFFNPAEEGILLQGQTKEVIKRAEISNSVLLTTDPFKGVIQSIHH